MHPPRPFFPLESAKREDKTLFVYRFVVYIFCGILGVDGEFFFYFAVHGVEKTLILGSAFVVSKKEDSFTVWCVFVLFFIFLGAVFSNISSKRPTGDSSFLSWPFCGAFASCSNNSASGGNGVLQTLQRPVNETLKANATGSVQSSDFVGSEGKDKVFEDTHVGNKSEKLQGGSFIVGEGSLVVKTDERNVSSSGRNTISMDGTGGGNESERDPIDDVKNETVSGKENVNGNSTVKSYEDCDMFKGRWVRDDTMPYYPPGSCPYIDRDFECHLNGRPDNEFLKWRWQPDDCDIPRLCISSFDKTLIHSSIFLGIWVVLDNHIAAISIAKFNATDFLVRLRGKKLVFVGDSLNRNMWESLFAFSAMLLKTKTESMRYLEGMSSKRRDYNCSVDFVSSPFLVKQSSFSGKNGSFDTLRLDLMDETTSMYHDADVMIFNTGHWWTHEKTSRGEDYYQEGDYVHPRLKALEAYKRALTTWGRWVDRNVDGNRTQVIFRGYSVTHFSVCKDERLHSNHSGFPPEIPESLDHSVNALDKPVFIDGVFHLPNWGGPWNSGGECHKETEPIFNETHLAKYPTKMKALEYVIKGMQIPVTYLNISRLSDYRKDGHPSIYRPNYEAVQEIHAQDCSHWCLPGVPDTWNELLYVSLLKSSPGS
ncbi:protein trichome birefringence-like 2 [Sesamum angolense]|uniref:Protein trichome birefringence-like 2 n=1 Tax=Sesamum angolense TaxID=2727404 RepID=A0AAE1WZZ6_9LAMI|nr:protein trichome birefringence-like 2 [Sesamum angolense]